MFHKSTQSANELYSLAVSASWYKTRVRW